MTVLSCLYWHTVTLFTVNIIYNCHVNSIYSYDSVPRFTCCTVRYVSIITCFTRFTVPCQYNHLFVPALQYHASIITCFTRFTVSCQYNHLFVPALQYHVSIITRLFPLYSTMSV